MKSRFTFFLVGIVAISLLILTSMGLPSRTSAQLNAVVIAPGFEFNIFADPTRVPEFAGESAYRGPVSMAFDARGRLFVGTYSGRILMLLDNNDDGNVDEVKTFASGLSLPLGIAFRANGDLFTTSNVPRGAGSIVRLRDTNGDDVADERTTIVDGLPSDGEHQTDRLRFGPDGLLYIGQGSSTDNGIPKPGLPGEGPLNATILRIDVDNPGAIDTFATGLRNPFGLAFHPETGELFATDGGSGECCPAEDLAPPEEVNWVVQGGNYGFPLCEGTPSMDRAGCAGVRAPAIQYPRHLTPTSLAFYTGPQALEFRNQLLLTLYKDLPNLQNYGGDLRRMIVEGDPSNGITLRDDGFIAQFNPIDPFDGPLDTAIDPISGDIYVARFDPVTHRDLLEHHHFIYRIHRAGSDAIPFIGQPRPAAVMSGSGAITVNIVGRHLKPGAMVLADGVLLPTRQGTSIFDLAFDLPASAISTAKTLQIGVRNPDGLTSNQQAFSVTTGPVDPPPDKSPMIAGLQVKKKKRVIDTVTSGTKAKKLTLTVTGTDFDAGVQLLVNGVAIELTSSSETELVAKFTKPMVAAPGELVIQARNSTGKVSNIMRLVVVAAQ